MQSEILAKLTTNVGTGEDLPMGQLPELTLSVLISRCEVTSQQFCGSFLKFPSQVLPGPGSGFFVGLLLYLHVHITSFLRSSQQHLN
jgi:hypothetical protein